VECLPGAVLFTVSSAIPIAKSKTPGCSRIAELGCITRRKIFAINREWNERVYAIKEVQPIFVEEADEIVVVTVYTYHS
jgi:hypothetical protein